jgi:CRP-like cAMP-binding protein
MSLPKLLAQSPIFTHLGPSDRHALAQAASTRFYEDGEFISHYGDRWPFLFIVERGMVTALKESAEGRSLIVVGIGPGDIFWGLAFFEPETPMIVSLRADEPTELHLWSREDLLPNLLADGRMTWEITRLMLKRMLHASDIVEELAFQPITSRLARLLLDRYGEAVDDYVVRDLTLDEMAARIGTKREVVCRQLYRFMDEGAIEINRTEFKISDKTVLDRLAGQVKG